jgi:tetratricopeptide (TPR) repeat protein
MSSRLEISGYITYKKGMRLSQDINRSTDKSREISKRKLKAMSDLRLRKKLIKTLLRRKSSKCFEKGLLYELELIEEASRRGIQTGLPAPVSVKEDNKQEKQIPDTYETARNHIKREEFSQAVRILWKLRCNGKAGETECIAREQGDFFTRATLRLFDAAASDTFDSYLQSFYLLDSLNSGQACAFYEEVVAKKLEFSSWDRKLNKPQEQLRLCPMRDDIADARMKAYAFKRKRKMLDYALTKAEQIDDGFSKFGALKEVALAFAKSGLNMEALSIFKKAEDSLPEKRHSDKEMYDYLMAMKDLGSTMAQAGLLKNAYSLFMRSAESASPFRSYSYDDDGIGALALIEIGIAAWEAGIDLEGVKKIYRDVHNILLSFVPPNESYALILRKKLALAYAKMDLGKTDLANRAQEEFEKVANEIFCSLNKEQKGSQKHKNILGDLVRLIRDLAEAGMSTRASEYLQRGIDFYDLEKFPMLLAEGYTTIGIADLKAGFVDRATTSFNRAMCMKREDPSLLITDMLTHMALAYAEAGLDLKARRKFEEASIETDKLPSDKKSIADVHYIRTYIQAADYDEFLAGINRKIMYEALCVHASNIEDSYYSVDAYATIAAAAKKNGMYNEARTILKKAEELAESDAADKVRALLRLQLAEAYAELGDLGEARKIARKLVYRDGFSQASAAIVIAKARRAARIDAEALTEEEKQKIMPHPRSPHQSRRQWFETWIMRYRKLTRFKS